MLRKWPPPQAASSGCATAGLPTTRPPPSRCPVPPRLFNQFILRRMLQERARTATTILGIALGIAVVIAIQLTNASSVRGFETALNTVAGRTSLEIIGTAGVDENLIAELGWLRDFGDTGPGDRGRDGDRLRAWRRARRSAFGRVLRGRRTEARP